MEPSLPRIGIFGGTFDPVHEGHINLASAAAEGADLDQVVFVPNYISPFKQNTKVTPGEMRCEMIRRILHRNPAFSLSDHEIRLNRSCYTWDTLSYFSEKYSCNLYFILGLDSLMTLDSWYRGEEIIEKYKIITGVRPGTDYGAAIEKANKYRSQLKGNITFVDLKPMAAASSEIRRNYSAGRITENIVPPEIIGFIEENGLYKD